MAPGLPSSLNKSTNTTGQTSVVSSDVWRAPLPELLSLDRDGRSGWGVLDQLHPRITRIVRLAKDIITAQENGLVDNFLQSPCLSPYSLSIRLVLPLNVVGLNCRHRAARRKAIVILRSLRARRDSIWDAAMLWRMIEWIADLKEDGLDDCEYVPPELAAKLVARDIDAHSRKAYLACILPNKHDPSMKELNETTISWWWNGTASRKVRFNSFQFPLAWIPPCLGFGVSFSEFLPDARENVLYFIADSGMLGLNHGTTGLSWL